MIAEIEKPDGTFETKEIENPICGQAYCDTCGDCLHCYPHEKTDYCKTGGRWIIYLSNPDNPYSKRKINE